MPIPRSLYVLHNFNFKMKYFIEIIRHYPYHYVRLYGVKRTNVPTNLRNFLFPNQHVCSFYAGYNQVGPRIGPRMVQGWSQDWLLYWCDVNSVNDPNWTVSIFAQSTKRETLDSSTWTPILCHSVLKIVLRFLNFWWFHKTLTDFESFWNWKRDTRWYIRGGKKLIGQQKYQGR